MFNNYTTDCWKKKAKKGEYEMRIKVYYFDFGLFCEFKIVQMGF